MYNNGYPVAAPQPLSTSPYNQQQAQTPPNPNHRMMEHVYNQPQQQQQQQQQQQSAIVLDCEYIYDPGDVKLVVRWFYNDSPEPIYQWIPSSDNRYVGELIRPYFDMNFQVSEDQFTKYRAIRLVPAATQATNATTIQQRRMLPIALSGKYTCVISSIMSQDSRQGNLMLYGKCDLNYKVSSFTEE